MALLTTLDSGMYSPTLCIRAGVFACTSVLVPDSGRMLLQNTETYNPNWPQLNCLKYQNARINGRYSLEDNFEQGYFNFENWSGQTTYSTNGLKSGFQANVGVDNKPYLVNFWGRGNTPIGNNALYKYNFESDGTTVKQKNITTSVVMSGVAGGPYSKMEVYSGTLSSGNISVYGRVGVTNTDYNSNDKILGFTTIGTSQITGDTGWVLPTTATEEETVTWTNVNNSLLDDSIYATTSTTIFSAYPDGRDYTSKYIKVGGFGFNILGYTIDSIEVFADHNSSIATPFFCSLFSYLGGSITSFISNTATFSSSMLTGFITPETISSDQFVVYVNFGSPFNGSTVNLDSIKVKINYSLAGSSSLDLLMRKINGGNYLCWKSNIINTEQYIGLNSQTITTC